MYVCVTICVYIPVYQGSCMSMCCFGHIHNNFVYEGKASILISVRILSRLLHLMMLNRIKVVSVSIPMQFSALMCSLLH